MKQKNVFFVLLALVCVTALFLGCPNGSTDGADTTALTAAIASANDARAGVEVDTDAGNVTNGNKWVTQEVSVALNTAIATAETVADDSDASQEDVDAALTALESAITAFNGEKQDGVKGIVAYVLEDQLFGTVEGGEKKYYSLSTGELVDAEKANTKDWDIAIERHSSTLLFIYTNSGNTATELNSGGQGGVWFTGKTDFDDASFSDRITDFSGENAEYASYVTDVTRYVTLRSADPVRMNIMTYFGFPFGDGLGDATNSFQPNTPPGGSPMGPAVDPAWAGLSMV